MKVFAMNDCDWVAAASLESAMQFYREYAKENIGVMPDDELMDNPHEVSAEDMDRLIYTDEDEPEKRTFREQIVRLEAERVKFPLFFASTEY